MAEENKIKSRTYIPKVYYKGELLPYKETPLTIKDVELCKYCKEEITLEQIQHVVPEAEKEITDKILVYLNKYRKDYKLDTCLRKAHFIAQVGAEMKFLKKNMQEGTSYHHTGLSIFGKKFNTSQEIDDTILNSLKEHLTLIFKITDKDGKTVAKTNEQLKKILKDDKVIVNVRELYGRRDKSVDKEKTLKTIKEKSKDEKGKEVEIVKYNIVLLKHKKSFGIETLSRAYASKNSNSDELSRDGYMYCGKGIKQITWKSNYKKFSTYRNENPFPDDPKKDEKIDFTKVTDKTKYTGNFDLLADTKDVIYAVQSALWYYQKGNPYKTKYTVDWADDDSIQYASYTINGGYNGLEARKDNTLKAKEDEAFKVYKHYKETHKKGTKDQKKKVEDILTEISKDNIKKGINLKDPKAEALLKELRKQEAIKITPKGIKTIPFEITTDLKLKVIEPKSEDNTKSKKKRKKKKK